MPEEKTTLKREMQFKSDEEGNIYYRYVYRLYPSDITYPVDNWTFYSSIYCC